MTSTLAGFAAATALAIVVASCAPTVGSGPSQTVPPTSISTVPPSSAPPPTSPPAATSTVAPSPIPLPTSVQLSVPSGGIVWALVAGTRLFRSDDRGDAWLERSLPPPATNVRISFISDREGWLLSSGSVGTPCPVQSIKIWHTTDGAVTWSDVGTAGISEAGCKDGIDFVSPTTGFVRVAGQDQAPMLYRTTDGGRSWSPTRPLSDPPGPARTADVRYWNGPVHVFGPVLLVTLEREATPGQTNFVYRSSDDGATWAYLATLPYGSWPGFVTAARWVQLVVPGQSQETLDAGASWHASLADYGQAAPILPQVEFGDPQVGYATVRGSIQRTVDGGRHWMYIVTPGTR